MRKERSGGDKVEGGNIEAAMRETSQEERVLIIIIFPCLQIWILNRERCYNEWMRKRNSGLRAGELSWDQAWPFEGRWLLCGLICFRALPWDQVFPGCMNWLFGAHSLWWGYLVQSWYMGVRLGHASTWYARIVDFSRETLPPLKSGGKGGKWRRQQKERERELVLACKMKRKFKKKGEKEKQICVMADLCKYSKYGYDKLKLKCKFFWINDQYSIFEYIKNNSFYTFVPISVKQD